MITVFSTCQPLQQVACTPTLFFSSSSSLCRCRCPAGHKHGICCKLLQHIASMSAELCCMMYLEGGFLRLDGKPLITHVDCNLKRKTAGWRKDASKQCMLAGA